MDLLYVGNDQVIEVLGVKDSVSGAFYNAATVSAQIKTVAGVNVGSAITLAYVTGSDGNYRGLIEDGTALTAGTTYVIEITVDAGSDTIGFWKFSRKAVNREP